MHLYDPPPNRFHPFKCWEKEAIHHSAPVRNFSLPKRKKGGHRGKISVVAMVFLVFIGFLYPPLSWKNVFEARKVFQKIFSYGGGIVRFLLPFYFEE